MKIVFFGSGEFGLPCLEAMAKSRHAVIRIVSQPSQPAGRGRRLTPTPVAQWASGHGVALMETADVNTPRAIQAIADCRPDLNVVIAFGQKIDRALVDLPASGSINVHASLLPRWRGAAPVNWAILSGDTQTGVSIITLADRIDAGEVLASAATPIGPQETAGQLHDRLAGFSAPLLLDTLDRIEQGTAVYTPQEPSLATLAKKLRKSDGVLDLAWPADQICLRVRGLSPWPGASAGYQAQGVDSVLRVTIAAARVVTKDTHGLLAGTLDQDLDVVCGRGAFRILQIKPAGSPLMDFKAFVNGRHVRPGDKLVRTAVES